MTYWDLSLLLAVDINKLLWFPYWLSFVCGDFCQARHQELLSQQQNFILATQSAQAFLDQHGHNLTPEEQQMLQEKLGELKEQYVTSLARSEAEVKQVQTLRDELQKFLQDHREFENWLERSEKELENMHKRDSSPEALPALLKRQGSFSEDVISHKGDLRFVTISGRKVLDTENSLEEGKEPSATGTLVKDKLKDATERYSALHSKVEERFLAAPGVTVMAALTQLWVVSGAYNKNLRHSEQADL